MATILFNTNKALPISYYTDNYLLIHNPNEVDSLIIKTALWNTHLIPLAKSYNSIRNNHYEGKLMELLTIHSYNADLWESFPLSALLLGYHSSIPPNMKSFVTKFCKNSTNEKGEVLICEYAYHEECFQEMDEDNCELEKPDNYKPKIETDSELQRRILDTLKYGIIFKYGIKSNNL
ncbi:hypothetical protein C1646_773512 [Rhizophagus diaphanus]|nr:hypothetical protein C1646_773512 [Rhizophagus diaphanus] [Rhizophagus sp. MUCL 43196]